MEDYREIINSADLVLVEFFATWCPHCQRMMPVVRMAKEQLTGMAEVFQFDIDKERDLAQQEGVESIPTFILYKNGIEVWRNTGEMELETLVNVVKSNA